MLEDNIKFNQIDEFGKMRNYIIIDRFSKNGKNYLIYEEEGIDKLYTSLFEIDDDKLKIIPITDNKDYDIVDEYLENL